MSDYQMEIKKPILDRQYSDASSNKSTPRSSRKASVASGNSQASAQSDISKYSSASFVDSNGQFISSQYQKDGGAKPALRRTYTDLNRDPGLEPLLVKSKRMHNVKLRYITSEERSSYDRYTSKGITSHFKDGNLVSAYSHSLRLPALDFVIAFDIKTRKGFVKRMVRLSHCNVPAKHSTAVLNVLSRMQAGLEDSEKGYAIPFPAVCLLSRADFPHGIREKHASVGTLQVDLHVVDPRHKTLKSAPVREINAPAGGPRAYYIASYWHVKIYIPANYGAHSGRYIVIPFSALDHQDAFSNRLAQEGTAKDLEKWIDDNDADGNRSHFTVTNVNFNMLGEVVSAKLNRVKAPFVPVLEADIQPAEPSIKKSRGWGRK